MIIISLTSFKPRLPFIGMCLETLYNQSLKADKIVLTLYKNDVRYIPFNVKRDIESGKLELLICDEDIKSHKKYYYVMQKYPNDIIITVDDDMLYEDDIVSSLYETYLKYPDCVCGRRCHKINGCFYKDWIKECSTVLEPSMEIMASGNGGILYPPNILKIEELDINTIYDCINSDDILLKWIQKKNGTLVKWVENNKIHPTKNKMMLMTPQLSDVNVVRCGNDEYLKRYRVYEL